MGGLIQESSPGGGGSGDAATETTLQSVLVQLLAILTELAQKTEPTNTQPISAVTLPLPTGAATDNGLAALLVELSAKLDEATFIGLLGEVQASPTANTVLARLKDLLTELSQKTEPADTQTISGTVTANAGTNLNTSALALEATLQLVLTELTQKTEPTDTQPVSAASLPLPTGASTAALQLQDSHNVTIDNAAGAAAVNVQDGGNALTVDGTIGTKTDLTPSAPTFATVGVASAQAVAAAATRKGLYCGNTSAAIISLAFGATAVLYSGITLYPGQAFFMDEYSFDTGAVNAIASAASSNLAVQEYLA